MPRLEYAAPRAGLSAVPAASDSPRSPAAARPSEDGSGKGQEDATCRLCWSEADAGYGGELLSPCRCSGSMRYIHRRCLEDWQSTLRSQGLGRRASHCELCKAHYAIPYSSGRGPRRRSGVGGAALPQHLALTARCVLADALRLQRWPGLALRLWKGYVMASGVVRALRVGAAGFAGGVAIGRALIEEQAGLLSAVLASMNGVLGSPYAELLFCQAVGALLIGMLSEVAYCGVLGGLGGLAYGFATGYVAAIRGSARLFGRVGCGAVSAVAWFAARAARRVATVALRV